MVYPAETETVVRKNGNIHLWTAIIKLPEGNCRIPSGDEGDYDVIVFSPSLGSYLRVKFTPSGNALLKFPFDF